VTWEKPVAKALSHIEHGIDRFRLSMMNTFGVRKPLRILTYIGHGTDKAVYLRGRVLLENKVRKPNRTDKVWTNIKNMYRRFESDEIPYAQVQATLGSATQTAQCDEEGFFEVVLAPDEGIPRDAFWQSVQVMVVDTPIHTLDTSDAKVDARVIVPPADAQFAVISDLDDTVMKTDAIHLLKMLRNTILGNAYTRLPFDGVATFYQALQRGTHQTHNPIFYVSSSPWNLYDMIVDFYRIRQIPQGPIFLRDIGITQHAIGGQGHMDHKLTYINTLIQRYPALPFILIGDSGQKDVKVYKKALEQNRGRIPAIYIRDVNNNDRRQAEIEAVAREVRALGGEMLLVKDTWQAAEHAAANGFIDTAYLAQIRADCQADSPPT
jgi:phosphatidate phosphatase APP1